MNLEEQKIIGTNQVIVNDSLEAPLLSIKISRTESTTVPETSNLIVYVDKAPKGTPTSERKQFLFELNSTLGYASSVSDQFVLEVVPKENDIIADVYVNRNVSGTTVLSAPEKEILDESLINLFKGTNYIYTNYINESIEIIYPKDDEFNRRYLNNAIYCNRRQNSSGDFSLEDIYFKDAFTKTEDKLNIEVENAEISTLTSKNNKFSLDANGNLVVNSITTNSGGETLNNTLICDLIYPIGSIYMSVNSTTPETLFGGTWIQLKDRFLLGAGDIYTAGLTEGSSTHVHATAEHALTIEELPSHTHIQNAHRHQTYNTWGVKIGTGATNYLTGNNEDGYSGSPNYTNTTTATNQNTGGGESHSHGNTGASSNMPPYLAVYIWKRTA